MNRILRNPWLRGALVVLAFGGMAALLWWRGPEWQLVADAFRLVEWNWIVLAIALNLASVFARALAWQTVINQALPHDTPPFPRTFSAFSIGLD